MDGELLSEFVHGRQYVERKFFARKIVDKIWTRFSIIPNIKGQIYTFGKTFKSREEHGELIYWPPQEQEEHGQNIDIEVIRMNLSMKGHSMCQISICDENKYWIMPLNENIVFINDIKIERRTKTELKFGDFLQLGEKPMSNRNNNQVRKADRLRNMMSQRSSKFLFTAREMNPEVFLKAMNEISYDKLKSKEEQREIASLMRPQIITTQKTVFTPGQNEYVLSHILSFLSIRQLKNIRFVSRMWSQEGGKLLSKRCTLHFNFTRYSGNYKQPSNSMKLLRYAHDIESGDGNFQILNWSLDFELNHYFYEDYEPNKTGAVKLKSDVNWFFSNGYGIKRLNVRGHFFPSYLFQLRINLFERLQDSLEELELDGQYFNNYYSDYYQFPDKLYFTKLKKFTLSFKSDRGNYHSIKQDSPNWTWLKSLIPAIKTVKEIHLNCAAVLACIKYLQKFQEQKSFPNLEGICVNMENWDRIVFIILLEMKLPLKKLDMKWLKPHQDKEIINIFEALIIKHANTLELLHFRLEPLKKPLYFPAFPKLKDLMILFEGGGQCNRDEEEQGEQVDKENLGPHLLFHGINNNGVVCYDKHFPLLQKLILWPSDYWCLTWNPPEWGRFKCNEKDMVNIWKHFSSFYEPFFPKITTTVDQSYYNNKNIQICKSVVILDIPNPTDDDDKVNENLLDNKNGLGSRAAKIATMFPNAFNKFFNSAKMSSNNNINTNEIEVIEIDDD